MPSILVTSHIIEAKCLIKVFKEGVFGLTVRGYNAVCALWGIKGRS